MVTSAGTRNAYIPPVKTLALLVPSLVALVTLGAGCAAPAADDAAGAEDAITSNDGKALELRFDGELLTDARRPAKQAALAQLEYLQGALITDVRGNAQFGHAELTAVTEEAAGDGKRVKYTASVPVIWQKNRDVPATYEVALPKDTRALSAFNAKYDGKCGTNEYGQATFWHDFNPKAQGCELEAADVHRATGTLREHPKKTTAKYPEYDRVWADGTLEVLGVFGIISSFTENDGGVREYNAVIAEVVRGMRDKREEALSGDTILRGTRITGKKTIDGRERTVKLTAVIVHSVSGAGRDFDAVYTPASETADFVYYGGHSGLGSNIAALANKAKVARDKYQIVYLNGCQTFGYLGTAWNDKKRDANGAERDPAGTKDLDIFVTGLPAYDDDARSVLEIYKSLEGSARPKTFNQILEAFASYHLNVVFGEDDNRFTP